MSTEMNHWKWAYSCKKKNVVNQTFLAPVLLALHGEMPTKRWPNQSPFPFFTVVCHGQRAFAYTVEDHQRRKKVSGPFYGETDNSCSERRLAQESQHLSSL